MASMSKKKKNEKKKKVLLLLVLLLTITVGFATLSAQLNINGTSKIKGNTWDLSPDTDNNNEPIKCAQGEVCTINPQDPANTNPDEGEPVCTDPNDQTTCTDPVGAVLWMDGNTVYFKHILTVPGDTFTFTYDFKNNGSIDAEVTGATVGYLNADAQNIANNFIDYTVEYDTATATAMGHSAVTVGDILAAGETATFKVTVTYKSSVETLPTAAELAIINNGADGAGATSLFTVNYEQA